MIMGSWFESLATRLSHLRCGCRRVICGDVRLAVDIVHGHFPTVAEALEPRLLLSGVADIGDDDLAPPGDSLSTSRTFQVVIEQVDDLPVITLLGDMATTFEAIPTEQYVDSGATAWDPEDGDISQSIEISGNVVDRGQPGSYTLYYDVTDSGGNSAAQVVRIVTVRDTLPPVIALSYGGEVLQVSDHSDTGVGGEVNVPKNLPTETESNVVGIAFRIGGQEGAPIVHQTPYTQPDGTPVYGRQAWVGRTAAGNGGVDLPTATAWEHVDANVVVTTTIQQIDDDGSAVDTVVPEVDFAERSTYLFKYDAQDSTGNYAEEVVFGLILNDTLPPVINVTGGMSETVEVGGDWTLPEATAWDNIDGDLTGQVLYTVDNIGTNTVIGTDLAYVEAADLLDAIVPGQYLVTMEVSDAAGIYGHENMDNATAAIKAVSIKDTMAPWINILPDVVLPEDTHVHMTGPDLAAYVNDQYAFTDEIQLRIANFSAIAPEFGLTIGMDADSGNFSERADNTIHVHPSNHFNGSTTVMIEACDPGGNVSQAKSFALTISPANDAPIAVPDSLAVVQGNSTTVLDDGSASVLDNDWDDGDGGLDPMLDANQVDWHWVHNLTPEQFSDDVNARKGANFLVDIEIDQNDDQQFLSGIWQHNVDGRPWAEHHDLTAIQFYELWVQYQDDDYRLIDQESYVLGSQRYYAGIWLKNSEKYAWNSHQNATSSEFYESFEQYKDSYFPSDIDAYTVDGTTRYAHLWVENTEMLGWSLHRDMTEASLAYYSSKYAKNYRVHDVEAYQVNGQQRYAAIWIENQNDRGWQHERGLNETSYHNHWLHYRDMGYRVTDFEKYETAEGIRYAGVWRQNTDRPDWNLRSSIDTMANDHLVEHDIPGMGVAIVQQGEIKYMRGFGHQDVAGDQWYSARTINRLASVSKAIGGVLLLKLADQGQVDPAALTGTYVTQMPGHHTHTLGELVSNRGGVGHYSQLGMGTVYNQYDTATEAAALFWNNDLVSSPGSSYFYSTHGYTLLGAGIEGATGQPMDDVLYNELGSALGLTTLKAEDRSVDNAFRTKLYNTNNTEAFADNISWKILGGGVEASAYDLARFSAMLMAGDILSNDSLQQLWTVPEPDNVAYAMGWSVGTQQGEFSIRKDGSQLGANTYLRLFPDLDLGIVVLSNRRVSEPNTLSYNIANTILSNEDPGSTDIVPADSSLTASLVTDVAHGNLVFNSDGTFIYTHDGSEAIQDSFSYQAHDGLIDSNIVTVTIVITPDNPLPATIVGTKYEDRNGNAKRDFGEPGLEGWTILLADANGNPLADTITDAAGNYSFSNLGPGTFIVSEQPQDGWIQTAPVSPGTFTVVISSGQNIHGLDFGNTVTTGVAPPRVTEVLVRGNWESGYLEELQNQNLGVGGYLIPAGSEDQLDPLPSSNLDQIVIRFSENVAIGVDDVRLVGVLGADGVDDGNGEYDVVNVTTGIGISGDFEAVIDLDTPIGTDKLLLTVFDSVTSLAGHRLDGQWVDGSSIYPSGDGQEGGDFHFRFNVLPCDTNQDGSVGGGDLSALLGAWLGGIPPVHPLIDVDGNTQIGGSDLSLLLGHWLTVLPAGTPSQFSGGEPLATMLGNGIDNDRSGLLGRFGRDPTGTWGRSTRGEVLSWQETGHPLEILATVSTPIVLNDKPLLFQIDSLRPSLLLAT